MKKINKIGKTLLVALPVLFIAGLFFFNTDEEKKEDVQKKDVKEVVEKVESEENRGKWIRLGELEKFDDEIKLFGKIEQAKSVKVFSEASGKILSVNANVGKYVKKGQILATLDSSLERNSLENAILSKENSELSLEKTKNSIKDEDIDSTEKNLEISQENLEKFEDDIQSEFEDLKIFLENFTEDEIDDFFAHTDNDSYIYHPTFTYRHEKESEIEKIEDERREFDKKWNSFESKEFTGDTENYIFEANKILDIYFNFTDKIYRLSKNIILSNDGDLDALEVKTLSMRNLINSKRKVFDNLESGYVAQKNGVDISKNNLTKLENGIDGEDIKLSENNISLSENNIQNAKISLGKKVVRAPMSGLISGKYIETGEYTNPGAVVFEIISSEKSVLKSSLAIDDVHSIHLGKKIYINDDEEAVVNLISPLANENGLIDFEAFISGEKIKNGTFVKIKIPISSGENSDEVTLPISSVLKENDYYYILVLDSYNKVAKKEVKFVEVSGEGIVVENNFEKEDRMIINVRGVAEGDEI